MLPGGPDAVHGEDHQSAPHQGKTCQPGRGHRLVEEQHPTGELDDRRDVLEDAERYQEMGLDFKDGN